MMHNTRQRRAVLAVLLDSASPLNASQVLTECHARGGQLSLSTVHRTLHALVEQSVVVPTYLPGSRAYYGLPEFAQQGKFFCHRCERLFCFAADQDALLRLSPPNYQAESAELFVTGCCGACSNPAEPG